MTLREGETETNIWLEGCVWNISLRRDDNDCQKHTTTSSVIEAFEEAKYKRNNRTLEM